jgi:hypothetical protein
MADAHVLPYLGAGSQRAEARLRMGYFNALTSSSFKTAQDGRVHFFPWGILGRGYVIPSEEQHRRLRGGVMTFMLISIPLIILANVWSGIRASAIVLAATCIPYAIWAWSVCRRLEPSSERMSMDENLRIQARHHSTLMLVLLLITAYVFAGISLLMMMVDPRQRLFGAVLFVLSAFAVFVMGRMLGLKNSSDEHSERRDEPRE